MTNQITSKLNDIQLSGTQLSNVKIKQESDDSANQVTIFADDSDKHQLLDKQDLSEYIPKITDEVISDNVIRKINPDDLEELLNKTKDVSDDIDANGDGKITQEELDNYNKSLQDYIDEFNSPKIEIDGKNVAISKVDTNGDGIVSQAEIDAYKNDYSSKDISDKLDLDGDGKITEKEVKTYKMRERIKKWFNKQKKIKNDPTMPNIKIKENPTLPYISISDEPKPVIKMEDLYI